MVTGVGVLLGTATYMSPEQARGKAVDKRSDIWAFGAVLYEMLTGNRAFAGDEVSDVLASVLAREPDWTLLPFGLSPVLATYIKRCLHKDRKHRIGDVQTLRLALEGAFDTGAGRVGTGQIDENPAHRRSTIRRVAIARYGCGRYRWADRRCGGLVGDAPGISSCGSYGGDYSWHDRAESCRACTRHRGQP